MGYEFWEEKIGINSYISIISKDFNENSIAIKDNISTEGIRTTCASKMLANYIPPYDASVIKMIKKAGLKIVGKTNMDEFAMGNSTETSFFGPTFNPWSLDRIPGGSSGGSATVVATFQVRFSLGSDTGGSIRNPASYNYILGLKPTYGAVSRFGLIAYAESLEQIGPFAKLSYDLAKLLYIISEIDEMDITMFYGESRVRYRREIKSFLMGDDEPRGKRIFVPTNIIELADDVVKSYFKKAIDFLANEGFDIEEGSLEVLEGVLPAYYIIAMVEASSNLSRFDGVKYGYRAESLSYKQMVMKTRAEGFGREVKIRILMGTFASSVGYKDRYYLRALKVRRWLKNELIKIFRNFDFIAIPTTPTPPPKFGESLGPKGYVNDIYTVIANLAGTPAISIPMGLAYGFLPLGFQLIGKWFSDADLIRIAKLFEGKLYDPRAEPKALGKKPDLLKIIEEKEEELDEEFVEEAKRIAYLARVLIEGEEKTYAKYFRRVLEFFHEIDVFEDKIKDLEPLYHPIEVFTRLRKDMPSSSLRIDEKKLKKIAPEIDEDGFLKIPRMY